MLYDRSLLVIHCKYSSVYMNFVYKNQSTQGGSSFALEQLSGARTMFSRIPIPADFQGEHGVLTSPESWEAEMTQQGVFSTGGKCGCGYPGAIDL